MSHIHELIDFAVAAFIVHKNKVLLIHHKILNEWLPPGGHVELDEDTDQALLREIKEETGLGVVICSKKPGIKSSGTKFLYTPNFLDIHKFNKTHRHIGLVYFAKAKSNKAKLNYNEHNAIEWFTESELKKMKLRKSVRFYALEALKQVG